MLNLKRGSGTMTGWEVFSESRDMQGIVLSELNLSNRVQSGWIESIPGVGNGTGWESRPILHPGIKIPIPVSSHLIADPWSIHTYSMYLAKPSFNHRSSHQSIVTKLPNHIWADREIKSPLFTNI